MRRLIQIGLAGLWCLGLACIVPSAFAADQGPSAQTMNEVSHSVVQVIARNCGGESRTGSGFLWGNSQQLVTARHVVTSCDNVSAYFQGHREVVAKPVRQLIDADLVLLQLDHSSSAAPLRESRVAPVANDRLQAIGFYYGVQTLDNKSLIVTIGSPILQDMLTDSLKQAVRQAGSPSLSARIVRMDGHLLPGLSGAPVINSGGEVVGIGSGGLKDGAAGVSWAIAASYLTQLANGPAFQQPRSASANAGVFFSTEEGFSGTEVTCGELNFVRLRHSTVGELAPSSDNPAGLIQLASTAGLSAEKLASIRLDSYVNPGSGGSFALPEGAEPSNDSGMCKVTLSGGKYVMWIASAHADSTFKVQKVTSGWENVWGRKFPVTWQENPYFSYWGPYSRPSDGLMITRKTFAGYERFIPNEAFETLMARGNTVIGVITMNREFNPALYQRCLAMPTSPGCKQVNADYLQWAASILGTFLATFPPQ